jgi:hypothetical protein
MDVWARERVLESPSLSGSNAKLASILLGLEKEDLARVLPLLESLVMIDQRGATPPSIVRDLNVRQKRGTLASSLEDPRALALLQDILRALSTQEPRAALPAQVAPPKTSVRAGPLARSRLTRGPR